MIAPLLVGIWAASVALLAFVSAPAAVALMAPALLLPLGWWIVAGRSNWITGFFGAALLLPPLPIALGNSGPHPALLFAAAGGWVGVLRMRQWRLQLDPVAKSMLVFFAILLASVASAAVYSGFEIAAGSLARVLLFGIAVYVYLFQTNGPGARYVGSQVPSRAAQALAEARASEPGRDREGAASTIRTMRWLLAAAFLVAVFACVDFYYQLPAPAGYGPQFVWLDTGVLRRAQGLFYEASTLGNFCAFFLVLIAVLFTGHERFIPRSMLALVAGALGAALVFSYSRASIICVAVGLVALFWLRGGYKRIRFRWAIVLPLGVFAVAAGVYWLFPAFARLYWLRLSASLEFFLEEPNRILSGRLVSWMSILNVLADHPWYWLTGIGYKTLPYSDLGAAGGVVADNMYLSLLMETGLPGLCAFLWMNFQILRMAYRAALRSSVFGIWMFCFWAGELIQMLSGDLFTYWRVLALYFWALAAAASSNEHPVR